VDPQRGSFADDRQVARVAALMARRARRVVVVADADKLGRSAGTRFARIEEMDELVTDRRADGLLVATMRRRGLKVRLV
jgi:DeoR family transcriptional regulator of aga operon